VQRMSSDRDHLEAELANLKAQKDELNKQLWEEETAIARGIDRLEGKLQQANNCALRLQLIPAEAKNAGGVSHQLELRKHLLQTEPHRLLNVDPKDAIKPCLTQLTAGFVRELTAAQDSVLEAEEAETKREDEKQKREWELEQLKGKLARLEEEEQLTRDENKRQLEELERENEQLREKMIAARSSSGTSMLQAQGELATLRKEHDDFLATAKHERERMHNHLVSELDVLTVHKEGVEQQLAELNEYLNKKLADLQAD